MKALVYLGVLLALPVVAFTPSAWSDGAGLSGQCYDDDDNPNAAVDSGGGEDEVRYDTDTGPEIDLKVLPGEHGATDAALKFALGSIEDGGQTGTACDAPDCYATPVACAAAGMDARYDYVEVDARVGNVYLQVCYRGAVSVAGDCPQHPTGNAG